MSYRIIFESFKINKLESAAVPKILLVILIVIRSLMTMAPVGDRNFQFLDYYLNRKFLDSLELVLPTWGNIQVLLVYLVGMFLSACLGLLYADCFILENEKRRRTKNSLAPGDIFLIPVNKNFADRAVSQESIMDLLATKVVPSSFFRNDLHPQRSYFKVALKDLLTRLPAMIAFSICMLAIFTFSTAFFMIPFVVLAMILFFTPLNSLYARNGLVRSMELSHAQTNGVKFSMFLNFLMQHFIFGMVKNILAAFLLDYHYSYLIIESFLFALQILAVARQYAIFYQIVALKQPYEAKAN